MSGETWVNGVKVSEQPLYDTAKIVGSVFQNPRSQFFNIIYNKNSPTSAGSEMNCRSEHKCSKEFYKQKKKTLVRVLELYYNNKKRTYCSKNDD